jgi:hypothetical protein
MGGISQALPQPSSNPKSMMATKASSVEISINNLGVASQAPPQPSSNSKLMVATKPSSVEISMNSRRQDPGSI